MNTGFSGIMKPTEYGNAGAMLEASAGVAPKRRRLEMHSHSIPDTTEETTEEGIPFGYCHCGCGQKTSISRYNDAPRGKVKGQPVKFIRGHNGRTAAFKAIARIKPLKPRPSPIWDEGQGCFLIPIASSKHEGLFALVDPEDVQKVAGHRWNPRVAARGNFYATADHGTSRMDMHRLILDFPDQVIDHINGDGLDNRRVNLRLCLIAENGANRRRLATGKSSRYKGVSRCPRTGRWVAAVQKDGKKRQVGRFASEIDAARAYDQAARDLHGEFALTNADLGLFDAITGSDTDAN